MFDNKDEEHMMPDANRARPDFMNEDAMLAFSMGLSPWQFAGLSLSIIVIVGCLTYFGAP
jgi:hypothetical protein